MFLGLCDLCQNNTLDSFLSAKHNSASSPRAANLKVAERHIFQLSTNLVLFNRCLDANMIYVTFEA